MLPSRKVFLLTHKCGNNYIEAIFRGDCTFRQYQQDDIRGEMPGPFVGDILDLQGDFLNIRCRNFNPMSVSRLLRHIDYRSSNFYLFTRHPASLFRSAASNHLRVRGEEWARTNRYAYLQGMSVHEALTWAERILHIA